MSQRQSARTQYSVEVVVAVDGETVARGSVIDISNTGMLVRYLPQALTARASVGATVTISGVATSGPFRAVGTIRRVDEAQGELGIELPVAEAEALRPVLDSPIAGTGTSP